MLHRIKAFAISACCCVLASCGGGGGTAVPSAARAWSGYDARFTVTVPARTASATRRAPAYLSPATQSLVIATDGSAPSSVTANVTPSSPGCAATAAGTTCVVDVAVAPGAQTFTVRAYDGLDGSGRLLGTSSVPVPPNGGGAIVDVSVTLNGVVSAVALALQGGSFTPGIAGTRTLLVTAADGAGQTITGSATYSTPVLLATSDGAVTLSTTTVTGPSTTVTATYDGTPGAHTAIVATLGTAPGATLTAVGTPTPAPTSAPTTAPTTAPTPAPSPTVVFKVQ